MWRLVLIVADRTVEVDKYCTLSRHLQLVQGDNVPRVLSVGQAGLIGAMVREYGHQGKYYVLRNTVPVYSQWRVPGPLLLMMCRKTREV